MSNRVEPNGAVAMYYRLTFWKLEFSCIIHHLCYLIFLLEAYICNVKSCVVVSTFVAIGLFEKLQQTEVQIFSTFYFTRQR